MKTTIQVILALLPFAVLFAAFLIFKLDAFKASLYAWILELVVVLTYYGMSPTRTVEASLWGVLTMWSGFLVLYMGQMFGQAYRNTGLLGVLLESVQSMLPEGDQEGRAVALVSVVGGFIGAFNGFATYPVTIPGLVGLGFDGVRAVTSYLIYFSWTLPFNSLFIAPNISNAASHVPVTEIVRIAGLLSIPLVFCSLWGFFKLLGYRFFSKKTQLFFWIVGLSNAVAIVLFSQVWPAYFILMLVAGAGFSLAGLYVYGFIAKRRLARHSPKIGSAPSPSAAVLFRAYAPLLVGVVIVLLTMVPAIAALLDKLSFDVSAWGYGHIKINVLTSSGFFILITALICYLFQSKKARVMADFAVATRRSAPSLATLFVGSAMVYLLVDSGQISFLAQLLSGWGKLAYASLFPALAFLGGMAFGQGLPGDFLFSQMQVPVAPMLSIPLAVLVGIVTVITMGPSNALKPTQIAYTLSLANLEGQDGKIFRICLPWQMLQLVITAALAVALVVF